MPLFMNKSFVALSLAGALAVGCPALASEPVPSQPPAAPPAQDAMAPTELTDEKLRQFVQAAEDVQKIQEDYMSKAESLQKDAEEQIVESVQNAGMSVEEFTQLVALVQSDPNLAQRLSDLQQAQ